MTAPEEPGPTPDLLAAELALGVLSGEDRARALRRVLSDPAFAREVADWRARLDALGLDVPGVDPGPEVERRVLAGVGAPAGRRGSLRAWRAATGVSAAAAAALLGLLVLRPPDVVRVPAPPAPVPPAPLVAVIAPEGAEPFAAVYDRAAREVRLTGAVKVPRGRDAELWAIGADGVPRALGLLTGGGANGTRVTVRSVTVGAGITLAISIEPLGGSPKPTPTGPVVATGKLVVA